MLITRTIDVNQFTFVIENHNGVILTQGSYFLLQRLESCFLRDGELQEGCDKRIDTKGDIELLYLVFFQTIGEVLNISVSS